jgi:hypothetical protein
MKKILIFLLSFLLFGLTSCIELVEEITVHKNKSGNIKYRLETTQLSSFLNSFTEILDISIENQLKGDIEAFALKLKSLEGIDSVQLKLEGKTGKYFLKFSFKNPDDLNNAMYSILGYEKNIFSPKYLKLNDHRFQRNNFSPWIKKYLSKEDVQISAMEFISVIGYKTIVNYPEKIKSFKGTNLAISEDRRRLTQKSKLEDVIESKTNVSIKSRR